MGYAALIGVPDSAFDTPGFFLEVIEKRAEVAWANWLQPIWLVRLGQTTVCTTAPGYARLAESVFGSWNEQSLLSPELLRETQKCFGALGWQPLEILYYPAADILLPEISYRVVRLEKDHRAFEEFSQAFSGNTYVILDGNHRILSWVGIKDHGRINEIAVGTEVGHRRKGLGKAVVARAVADILSRDRVPIYVPDDLANTASYALAYSLGFQKAGEMLLWEVEQRS